MLVLGNILSNLLQIFLQKVIIILFGNNSLIYFGFTRDFLKLTSSAISGEPGSTFLPAMGKDGDLLVVFRKYLSFLIALVLLTSPVILLVCYRFEISFFILFSVGFFALMLIFQSVQVFQRKDFRYLLMLVLPNILTFVFIIATNNVVYGVLFGYFFSGLLVTVFNFGFLSSVCLQLSVSTVFNDFLDVVRIVSPVVLLGFFSMGSVSIIRSVVISSFEINTAQFEVLWQISVGYFGAFCSIFVPNLLRLMIRNKFKIFYLIILSFIFAAIYWLALYYFPSIPRLFVDILFSPNILFDDYLLVNYFALQPFRLIFFLLGILLLSNSFFLRFSVFNSIYYIGYIFCLTLIDDFNQLFVCEAVGFAVSFAFFFLAKVFLK